MLLPRLTSKERSYLWKFKGGIDIGQLKINSQTSKNMENL